MSDSVRWNALGTSDIIILFGGTNDFGYQHNPLGNYQCGDEYTDMKQFSVAYAYLLSKLLEAYPSSIIVCCTIPTRRSRITPNIYPIKQESVRNDATDTTTHFLFEFNDTIRKFAKSYGCYICEWSNIFNYFDSQQYFVDNEIHPNAMGHELMYKVLKNTIIDIMLNK